jgi:hypothetical protein
MNRMTPDLARLLVEERLSEAAQHRQRRTARRATTGNPTGGITGDTTGDTTGVPRQRRAGALMNRLFPGYGVRVPTR